MNKQRKVVITTTYNEMGIIIDTKAEEISQTDLQSNLQPTCNQLATDCISRQAAKGKWIEAYDPFNRISGRCSVCGWEAHLYEDDVVGMNYCPNCGARMEGEIE